MSVVKFIRQFVRDEEGVTAIEYGLIATLVAVAIIVGAGALGTKLNDVFQGIADVLARPAPKRSTRCRRRLMLTCWLRPRCAGRQPGCLRAAFSKSGFAIESSKCRVIQLIAASQR